MAGTIIAAWHFGHFTFFDAADSGALSFAEHAGQVTEMGM
jgi:hypothetical protein